MDVRCRRCGEPVDIDHFHDVAEELGTTFDRVRSAFMAKGCEALGEAQCEKTAWGRDGAGTMIVDALADLLGDDIDGIASELADAEWLGLL